MTNVVSFAEYRQKKVGALASLHHLPAAAHDWNHVSAAHPVIPHPNGEFELEMSHYCGPWANFIVRHVRHGRTGKRIWALGWNFSELRLAHTDARRDLKRRFPEIEIWATKTVASMPRDHVPPQRRTQ